MRIFHRKGSDGLGLFRGRRREYSIPKGQMVRAFGKILHDVKLGFEEEEEKQGRNMTLSFLHWRHCRAEGIPERGNRALWHGKGAREGIRACVELGVSLLPAGGC